MLRQALVVGALAVGASVSIASAQEGWSGYYIGVHAGYLGSTGDTTRILTNGGAYFTGTSITALQDASVMDLDNGSYGGGASFGMNWDIDGFVMGFEVDADGVGSEMSESATVVYPCCGPREFTTSNSIEQTWFGTARARIGIGGGKALAYVTGGLAIADTKLSQTFSDTITPIATQTISSSEIMTGWTAGAGLEVGIESGTSLKFEYLYLDLGEIEAAGPIAIGGVTSSGRADVVDHVIRAGLNFSLN